MGCCSIRIDGYTFCVDSHLKKGAIDHDEFYAIRLR